LLCLRLKKPHPRTEIWARMRPDLLAVTGGMSSFIAAFVLEPDGGVTLRSTFALSAIEETSSPAGCLTRMRPDLLAGTKGLSFHDGVRIRTGCTGDPETSLCSVCD
jgi:hypothetical protein